MLYELKTYQLPPGVLAEAEKNLGAAYANEGSRDATIVASWHTEIGPLNQIVQVWGYPSLAQRPDTFHLPAAVESLVIHETSEVLVPFSFSPLPEPGKHGPVYELRYYSYKSGMLQQVSDSWGSSIDARMELSPLWLAGYVQVGDLNHFIHIWPYASLDSRAAIRAKSVESGVWPPPGGAGRLASQANKILLPAAFSPAQ